MSLLIYFTVGFLILIILHVITLYIVFRKRKKAGSHDYEIKRKTKKPEKRIEFSWGYPEDDKDSHNADVVISLADIIEKKKSTKSSAHAKKKIIEKISIKKHVPKKPKVISECKKPTKIKPRTDHKRIIDIIKKDITTDLSEKISEMGIGKGRITEILIEVKLAVDRIMEKIDIDSLIDTTKDENNQATELIRLISPMLTKELKKLRYE